MGEEDCVAFEESNYKYRTRDCTQKLYFLCEEDPDGIHFSNIKHLQSFKCSLHIDEGLDSYWSKFDFCRFASIKIFSVLID